VLPSPSTTEAVDAGEEAQFEPEPQKPPVTEGEQRTVEIEDIGDQGDGITRVERGFVVIVSDTEQESESPSRLLMSVRTSPLQTLLNASATTTESQRTGN